jgi:23S rRNA (adenine2503-C2)-methyltransferase
MPYLVAPEAIGDLLGDEPAYRADQVRAWLYATPVLDASEMTNLPLELRDRLAERLWPFHVEAEQSADGGRTRKWLFRCPDGAAVESVLMAYANRTTLCISSQAGCAMACSFCATGQFGFERHLEAGEIVAQVAHAKAWLKRTPIPGSPDRIGNVVFMGMGEPLANYERVRESIRRLVDVMGMSARSITVSTVGVAPAIRRLAAEPWPVRLALSLHATDDELRDRLVPLNTRYPIDDLVAAADEFRRSKGRRVSLEWTLIDGVNDTPDQARALASIAAELRAHVNIIPLNPTPLSEDRPPAEGTVRDFADAVQRAGANVTVRDTRGRDIDAACGQLRARRASPGTGPVPR